MNLAEINRFDTAVALIHRGMRLSIVSHVTGIQPKTLRSLCREIHGCRPVSGQIPSTSGILVTRWAQAMASVLAALYRTASGTGIYDQINLSALLVAYDIYLQFMGDVTSPTSPVKLLNITQAWVIARDIRTGVVYFRKCSHCGVDYICTLDCRLSPSCPICALRRRDC